MPLVNGKTKKTLAKELSARGVSLTSKDGEHRVNLHGHQEESAYYTDDLHDAYQTGRHMSNSAHNRGLQAAKGNSLAKTDNGRGYKNLAHKESSNEQG